jgi:dihydroxyacetone kinase
MSVSLTACSVPGKGPSFTLKADEMELGLGATLLISKDKKTLN